MASKLDFAAALGEQLKAAGAQMRAMRAPKDEASSAAESAAENTPSEIPTTAETTAAVPSTAEKTPTAEDAAAHKAPQAVAAATPPAPPTAKRSKAPTPSASDTVTTKDVGTSEDAPAETSSATASATVVEPVTETVTQRAAETIMETATAVVTTEDAPAAGIPPAPAADDVPRSVSSEPRHAVAEGVAATEEAPTGAAGKTPAGKPGRAAPPTASSPIDSAPEDVTSTATDRRPDDGPDALPPGSPALSDRAWRGGVRGAVLDMLHQLAPGQDHVLVNLKRLAAHMGISYGSVRNAMSRLVQSGEVATRQIRVADGHGVRVDFLDDAGRPQTRRGHARRDPQQTAQSRPGRASRAPAPSVPAAPGPDPSGTPSFWDTPDDVFALAWPHAAAAGAHMELLRPLRAVFAAQGFSEAGIPRSLRHLDWQLERLTGGTEAPEAQELLREFLSRLRRQGYLPRPQGYEDPEVLRLREEADEQRARAAARVEHS